MEGRAGGGQGPGGFIQVGTLALHSLGVSDSNHSSLISLLGAARGKPRAAPFAHHQVVTQSGSSELSVVGGI